VSLRPESRALLDKVATLVEEFPEADVRAEGHTDSIPVSSASRWSSNWELSAARAAAVVRYLQDKGIAPERLASTGYSFYRPVASNDTPEGRAANRRIEITLEPKEG
jgi:chemotaxis protein MotB